MLRLFLDPGAASTIGRAVAPMLIYILMAAVLFFRPAGLFFPSSAEERDEMLDTASPTTAKAPPRDHAAPALPARPPLLRREALAFALFAFFAIAPGLAQLGAESYLLSLVYPGDDLRHRGALARPHPRLTARSSPSATPPSSGSAATRSAS